MFILIIQSCCWLQAESSALSLALSNAKPRTSSSKSTRLRLASTKKQDREKAPARSNTYLRSTEKAYKAVSDKKEHERQRHLNVIGKESIRHAAEQQKNQEHTD